MYKKRIVLLGDSLGMPRPSDNVNYEDTYPFLLKNELENFEIISKHKRTNDTSYQTKYQNIHDDIIWLKPDIVVIHLGIVDCAPRLFSKRWQLIISHLKYINKYIVSFMSKRRFFFTRLIPIVYVTERKFLKNYTKMINICKQETNDIIVVNILNTSKKNEDKSYGFKENINNYNEKIRKIAEKEDLHLLDINSIQDSDMLLEDGIHLTHSAQNKITIELKKIIERL